MRGWGPWFFPLSDCWVAWNQPFRKKIKIRAARCGVRHAAKWGVNFFLGERVLVVNLEKSDNQIAARRAVVGLDPVGKRTKKGANGNCGAKQNTFGWLFS